MNYDNRPGALDGPPKGPSLPQKLIGVLTIGVPITLVLTAMVWATAWLIVNFPA